MGACPACICVGHLVTIYTTRPELGNFLSLRLYLFSLYRDFVYPTMFENSTFKAVFSVTLNVRHLQRQKILHVLWRTVWINPKLFPQCNKLIRFT